jgi:organic hydroperoxide reductase OsmC/OhrA
MAEFRAVIRWKRDDRSFSREAFSRDHTWAFPGGIEVAASSAPLYRGDGSRVNPEEAFVASLSSCHMLTFLAMAAAQGFVVDAYTDEAVGVLARDADKELAITRVTLRPHVTFGGGRGPTADELAALHAGAHARCFIARSVKTEVVVAPGGAGTGA